VNAELRTTIGAAWAFRTRVEREAAERFNRLGAAIASRDPASPIVALMGRAATDERRHAAFCAELAARYGEAVGPEWPAPAPIAPAGLGAREAILYEVVASCCITETESVATVAWLLGNDPEPTVREILHQIAKDEVVHGRMGWTHLAREIRAIDTSFVSRLVPAMLSGTVGEGMFARAPVDPREGELLHHGVLPADRKKEIFVRTLEEVVLPGLEQFGIDAAPARAWLSARAG
jgi:hypothetical protein